MLDNNTINSLVDDGFSFASPRSDITELALLSLKIALEAYFSTYQSMAHTLSSMTNPQLLRLDAEEFIRLYNQDPSRQPLSDDEATIAQWIDQRIKQSHNTDYRRFYAETIVHFQHFAELTAKDFLRSEHELLSVDAKNDPVILYKLLKNQSILPADTEKLKSIEFSESLERIKKLRAADVVSSHFDLIMNYEYCLRKLNELRNRVWHRGAYILRYKALDRFIIGCILPFIASITSQSTYAKRTSLWKYQPINCRIDPLIELLGTSQGGNYTAEKVAMLKELGRAAYRNPIQPIPSQLRYSTIEYQNTLIQEQAEQTANAVAETDSLIRECPVCGVRSLVLYTETYTVADTMEPEQVTMYTHACRCFCCSFAVDNAIGNPRDHGLDLEDFWFIIN